jgi:hypothetical protein
MLMMANPTPGRPTPSTALPVAVTSLILAIYLAYVGFVIAIDRGPIDFETFMSIGTRFAHGDEVYIENSYYPLPYVAIFALFSLMPRPISMAVWMLGPVVLVLTVTRYRPYGLLFAPVFSHFAGGQSSVFGLLGFYGYRANIRQPSYLGGIFLALTCLKPQLGLVPVGYAMFQWLSTIRSQRRIPKQALAFLTTLALMYLPAFILRPTWLVQWLSAPRPVLGRAVSSAIPRLLLFVTSPNTITYWLLWIFLSSLLVAITWRAKRTSATLDLLVLLSFIISPLMHDYDLIQVLPIVSGPLMPIASSILSIPGWWTITTQYANDVAWASFTIIAPGLLLAYLAQSRALPKEHQGPPNNSMEPTGPAAANRDRDTL